MRPGAVFFLGAGASRPFGLPVTREILPRLLRRLRARRLFRRPRTRSVDAESSAELHALLRRLLPGLFRAGAEPPLITDLLSLVDELLAAGNVPLPGLDLAALARLRGLLERGVAEVLAAEEGARPPAAMRTFARWIAGQTAAGRGVAIVSTNYDFALEKLLLDAATAEDLAQQVDFGVSWRPAVAGAQRAHPRPTAARLGIYKLHGSLHWLRCRLCDHVYIDPWRALFRLGQDPRAQDGQGETCVCGHGPLSRFLVTPSMVRDRRDPNLLSVWQSALEALRTAESWTVIGYSMPPEDVAIRSLLLRAYRGRRRPPIVRVVERKGSAETERRYRLLFPAMDFLTGGVEAFVRSLAGQGGGRKSRSR